MGRKGSARECATSADGIKRAARELIRQVARVVHGWQVHFVQQGVCRADMELLQASIDRDALRVQRVAFL